MLGCCCPLSRNHGKCRYQREIESLLADNPDFIKPESRRNEVMGWVKAGLKDFSLSRAKVEWGIRVPWDPSQTFYVWTDALMGYLTGAAPTLSPLAQETHMAINPASARKTTLQGLNFNSEVTSEI